MAPIAYSGLPLRFGKVGHSLAIKDLPRTDTLLQVARGGRATDFYEKRGQGVRCDIRETY